MTGADRHDRATLDPGVSKTRGCHAGVPSSPFRASRDRSRFIIIRQGKNTPLGSMSRSYLSARAPADETSNPRACLAPCKVTPPWKGVYMYKLVRSCKHPPFPVTLTLKLPKPLTLNLFMYSVSDTRYEGAHPILEPFFEVYLRHDRGLVTLSSFRSF